MYLYIGFYYAPGALSVLQVNIGLSNIGIRDAGIRACKKSLALKLTLQGLSKLKLYYSKSKYV